MTTEVYGGGKRQVDDDDSIRPPAPVTAYRAPLLPVPEAKDKSPWFGPMWGKYRRHFGVFLFCPAIVFLGLWRMGVSAPVSQGVALIPVLFGLVFWVFGAFDQK